MKELVKISCYIEEYSNQNGKLCARLRDKTSNKKVVLMGHNTDKNHLLRFLAQAKIHQDIMPTIYDKDVEGTSVSGAGSAGVSAGVSGVVSAGVSGSLTGASPTISIRP